MASRPKKTGTALRSKGYYNIGGREFVAASTVLNLFDHDATMAHNAWISGLVETLVDQAKKKEMHKRWVWVTPDGSEDGDKGHWAKEDAKPIDCLQDRKYIQGEGFRQMRVASERGNVVHTFAEQWAGSGGAPPCPYDDIPHWVETTVIENGYRVEPDVVVPYIESQYIWLEEINPKILISEYTCFHEKLGYAGTMDGIMQIGKSLFHFDWKASKQTYPRHLIQVACYRHSTHIIDDLGSPIPNIKTLGAGIIHVKPQGVVWRHRPITGPAFNDFKRILALYRGVEKSQNALVTHDPLTIHKRQMDKLRDTRKVEDCDTPADSLDGARYWHHAESDAVFRSGPVPDEFATTQCSEITLDEYKELGGE